MSMSGIELDPEIPKLFEDMKIRNAYQWATFKIENKKLIVIDAKGERKESKEIPELNEDFDNFTTQQFQDDPKYALFDCKFTSTTGRKIDKMVFIFWCPDDKSKVGDKMIYASTKDTIKKAFSGLSFYFQINSRDDLDFESIIKDIEKKA